MGATRDLLEGLASAIAAAGIGIWTPTAAYAQTDIGISIGKLAESCDRAIGITPYGTVNDHPTQALGTRAVQIAFRGAPDDFESMTDLQDAVFQLLQGAIHQQYGSFHAIQILRHNSVPLGQDVNRRFECADNYYIDCNTPPTPNRNQ